jgi:excisionase family DNA binding protein
LATPVLTVAELCSYFKVHPSTIYRLLKTRQLPAFRIGSDWRFNIEEIERWLAEREAKPEGSQRNLAPRHHDITE